jgi:hypothetical protein
VPEQHECDRVDEKPAKKPHGNVWHIVPIPCARSREPTDENNGQDEYQNSGGDHRERRENDPDKWTKSGLSIELESIEYRTPGAREECHPQWDYVNQAKQERNTIQPVPDGNSHVQRGVGWVIGEAIQ